MTFPPMRPQVEIQHVHDMLMDVLADGDLRNALIPREWQRPMMLAADCLCWILHHDVGTHPNSHATNFASIVQYLREDLADAGHTWDAPGEYIVEE